LEKGWGKEHGEESLILLHPSGPSAQKQTTSSLRPIYMPRMARLKRRRWENKCDFFPAWGFGRTEEWGVYM